jgi:hypothetical protein
VDEDDSTPEPASPAPRWARWWPLLLAHLAAVVAGARHPVASQLFGGAAALAGLAALAGAAWALLVGGVLLAALGTLREAKVI